MKACNACKIRVQNASQFCPLCGEPMENAPPTSYPLPQNHYPEFVQKMRQYNLLFRLFVFLSLFGGVMSVLVNLLTSPGFLWCIIVVASIVYCWLTIPPMLRRGHNYASQAVFQVILTAAFLIVIDFLTGYRGWSVDYVVPSLLSVGILSIGLMAVFNCTRWAQYVLYQVIMGVFGFLPLVLYLTGIAHSLWMVLVAAGLALSSLLVTIVFGDRTIKSEFKSRFHL
ncbi:MAG: DUF6320 domain-containing protein [Oscillospiraceae bacterium]